jgi:cytoskeletal protein CcmA (bactofilin family)
VPKSRKVNTLNSYATIRAVARAKPAPASPVPAPARDNPAQTDVPPADLQKPGARVARTALPVKHLIVCYECGYKFQTHGRVSSTHCPKCRALLDLTDHTIDTEWSETIKTAGTIHLTPGGVLKNGDLIGADVIVEGIIEGGRVRAMRTLELGAGAIFSEKVISAPDLRIGRGADSQFKQPAKYCNVEVCGTLRAKLEATGIVTVKAGGLLEGEVRAEHLIVEDGGGLKADVRIAPRAGGKFEPTADEA